MTKRKLDLGIVADVGKGFVFGVGIDQLLYAVTGFVPQLAEPSPIVIPGYAPAGTHWDDLISLGISGAVAVMGAVQRNTNMIAQGAAMALGNYISSQYQFLTPPFPTTSREMITVNQGSPYSNLIQID